jgi:hypothetical protein
MTTWKQTNIQALCGNSIAMTFLKEENKVEVTISNYHSTVYVNEINGKKVHQTFKRTTKENRFL